MSTSTILNSLPKNLRDELKNEQLYKGCFTDETTRATVKEGHAMLVHQGADAMIVKRQEALYKSAIGVINGKLTDIEKLQILTDIEVLRFFLIQLKGGK